MATPGADEQDVLAVQQGVKAGSDVATFIYQKSGGYYWLQGEWKVTSMDDHISGMLAQGWEVVESRADGRHLNFGRTALRVMALGLPALLLGKSRAKVVALGLPALLFGASRTKEKVTITFRRSGA